MNGCITMIGFGSAPTAGWETQTIEWRLNKLAEVGLPPNERQWEALPGKVGLSQFLITTQSSTELAIAAAQAACADAAQHCPEFSADKIRLVLSGGASVDRFYPATACKVQDALGIPERSAQACDILSACASFGEALHQANALMRVYNIEFALLSFGETIFSQVADKNGPQDVSWCLWGDGGGAVVLRYDPNGPSDQGLLASRSVSDGQFAHYTCSHGLGCAARLDEARNPSMGEHGSELQRYLITHMPDLIESARDSLPRKREIDFYIPHAANQFAGRRIGKRVGVPEERVLSLIEARGNTSSASIPITLAYYVEQGRFKPGDVLALNAFGGGMIATCAIYMWPE